MTRSYGCGTRNRMAVECHQPEQRRVRHTPGVARVETRLRRRRLEGRRRHPDQMGIELHRRPVRQPQRREDVLAGTQLVLTVDATPRTSFAPAIRLVPFRARSGTAPIVFQRKEPHDDRPSEYTPAERVLVDKAKQLIERYELDYGNSECFIQRNNGTDFLYTTLEAPNHGTVTATLPADSNARELRRAMADACASSMPRRSSTSCGPRSSRNTTTSGHTSSSTTSMMTRSISAASIWRSSIPSKATRLSP